MSRHESGRAHGGSWRRCDRPGDGSPGVVGDSRGLGRQTGDRLCRRPNDAGSVPSRAARSSCRHSVRTRRGRHSLSKYIDGDGDGIRSRDIADGVDQPLEFVHALSDHYAAVRIGFADSVPPIDAALASSGSDPVRFGPGDILTFGPVGTATSGTLYLAGPGQQQYAVRVLGTTGRLRVMRFDQRSRRWTDR